MVNRLTKWAVIGAVVVSLTASQLELTAFAQNPASPVSASGSPSPVAIAAVTQPAPQQTAAPAKAKKSSKLKWILIAAAGAGAVVAIVLAKRESGPSVTIGQPTVGGQ